jgi:ABC-type glycerol-3-phosphate transport system permease component
MRWQPKGEGPAFRSVCHSSPKYRGLNQWGIMLADLMLSVLPILIPFIVGKQYFVQGIILTDIKD